jgi:hypothetical protein
MVQHIRHNLIGVMKHGALWVKLVIKQIKEALSFGMVLISHITLA